MGGLFAAALTVAFVWQHAISGAAIVSVVFTSLGLVGVAVTIVGSLSWRVWDYTSQAPRVEIREVILDLLSDEEFAPYAKYRKELEPDVIADKPRIRESVRPAAALIHRTSEEVSANATISRLTRLRAVALLSSSTMLLACGAAAAINSIVGKPLAGTLGLPLTTPLRVILVVTCAGVAAILLNRIVRIGDTARMDSSRLRAQQWDAEKLHQRDLRAAVGESFRRALNSRLERDGILAMATRAPRLVELDTSEIRPSRPLNYLRSFINDHDSSAIGIAGYRGAGKSTVMRALVADRDLTHHSVYIATPVAYNETDFVRHILLEVAQRIANEDVDFWDRRQVDGPRRARLGTFGLVLSVGVALFLADFLPAVSVSVTALRVLGIAAIGYGTFGLFYSLLVSTRTRRVHRHRFGDRLRGHARQILDDLHWETETSHKTKNILKLATFGDLEDEAGVSRRQRTMSRIDYTSQLRMLLRNFSTQGARSRFVICIDELDKLPSSELLVSAVNNLKDLFHIQGVHFVVSVSIDALRAFERRGLPHRDAFDSAFDTVIDVDRLTLAESTDIIASRATEFPSELARYCHAWSGGLPRDLLRAARKCIELQRASESSLGVSELVQELVESDLATLFDGLLESHATQDDHELIWKLRQRLESLRTWADITSASTWAISKTALTDEAFSALTRYRVGMQLIALSRRHSTGHVGAESADQVESWFELLAAATASMASSRRAQTLALERCEEGIVGLR
jgi:hypothetical protein